MARNQIGKTIYLAMTHPTANTNTAFEALAWVLVKGPITLPQLGVSHAQIEVPDVATGFTKSVKGAVTGVDTTASFRIVASDTGQTNMKGQAEDPQGTASIKLVTGSGADAGDGPVPATGDPVQYAQGFVHTYQENPGTTTDHEGFTVSFRQNDFTINATEPA